MITSMLQENNSVSLNIQESSLVKEKRESFNKQKNHLDIITTIKEGDKLSKIDKVGKDKLPTVICSVKAILSQTNFSRAKIFQISIKSIRQLKANNPTKTQDWQNK